MYYTIIVTKKLAIRPHPSDEDENKEYRVVAFSACAFVRVHTTERYGHMRASRRRNEKEKMKNREREKGERRRERDRVGGERGSGRGEGGRERESEEEKKTEEMKTDEVCTLIVRQFVHVHRGTQTHKFHT